MALAVACLSGNNATLLSEAPSLAAGTLVCLKRDMDTMPQCMSVYRRDGFLAGGLTRYRHEVIEPDRKFLVGERGRNPADRKIADMVGADDKAIY